MRKSDTGKFYNIPDNYQTGISMFGTTFKAVNLIEAAILAVIPWILFFFILPKLDLNFPIDIKTIFSALFCVFGGYGGLYGYRGKTLSQVVQSLFSWRLKRRVAYYNPRIKAEVLPIYMNKQENNEMLPREKVMLLFEKYKKELDKKQQQEALNLESEILTDRTNVYFEDDIGVVDKPVEYMTAKEYKAYRKKVRKEEKRIAKEKRREELNAKKEAKRKEKERKKAEKTKK